MLTTPLFSFCTGINSMMKNSDTQVGLSHKVFIDEVKDFTICHLSASLHPDWQLAWGQVLGLLVLFCAREVSLTTMLNIKFEEISDLCTIAMGSGHPLTKHPAVSWWNHFEQRIAAYVDEGAEPEQEVNTFLAGE